MTSKSVARRLGLGVALVCVAVPAMALAQPHYDTTVRKPTVREHPPENGGHLVVATRISSSLRRCQVGREVSLYQEHGSIDLKIDRDYTDSGGRAVFNAYGPQAFYYVRAEPKSRPSYFCPSRRSVVSSAF